VQKDVLDKMQRVLNDIYPNIISAVSNLVPTFRDQGRLDEAVIIQIEFLEKMAQAIGTDHLLVTSAIKNRAIAPGDRDKLDKTLAHGLSEHRQSAPSDEHLNRSSSVVNLESAHGDQYQWEYIEKLEVQVLEMTKTKLGKYHPLTLTSMANLAAAYRSRYQWKEAEELEVQVLELTKTKLGSDHPSTITSQANLASTLWNQGRWNEAEELFVRVIEVYKAKFGIVILQH
jgi:tetratricopeptide (TPR) repeat protein